MRPLKIIEGVYVKIKNDHLQIMKAVFFLCALLCLGLFASSQTKGNVKLYGYRQAVSQGKAPEIDENTKTRISEGAGKNYYLYALSSSKIVPVEAWIEGRHYGLTAKIITNTPVEYGDENNIGSPKKVLVPKTTQKVFQLTIMPPVEGKSTGKNAKPLSKANEFVLVYKQNGKFYYTYLKSLAVLNRISAL